VVPRPARRIAAVCAGFAIALALGFAAASAAQRAERRSSGHPAAPADAKASTPTPAGPRRQRTPAPAGALSTADAGRLAEPACAAYLGALAGRFPDAVLARGAGGALARVSESVAAALLGLPVDVPKAGLAAREDLDRGLRSLSRAFVSGEDVGARATAIAPRIRAYAGALGIDGCG
jgi:hypothetical protein